MHKQPSVSAKSQAPTRASSSTRPPRPRQQVSSKCYACSLQVDFAKTPSCLGRGKRCTFCNFKGHTASVCWKKAAASNKLNVELAG